MTRQRHFCFSCGVIQVLKTDKVKSSFCFPPLSISPLIPFPSPYRSTIEYLLLLYFFSAAFLPSPFSILLPYSPTSSPPSHFSLFIFFLFFSTLPLVSFIFPPFLSFLPCLFTFLPFYSLLPLLPFLYSLCSCPSTFTTKTFPITL